MSDGFSESGSACCFLSSNILGYSSSKLHETSRLSFFTGHSIISAGIALQNKTLHPTTHRG
ncbi:hypothetical protein ACFPK9_16040 [Rubritalea spongiae]|uniref:Uncharacterized protein n=1 Tax=Rubritalea spongiae TaxID=430797 RepID=A0ABW5E1Q5_9BACT